MREQFEKDGLISIPVDGFTEEIDFLASQVKILKQMDQKRPWYYWEMHNPWSRSSTMYDSWGFLDVCQSPSLIDIIKNLIGNDVILFDSRFYPDMSELKNGPGNFRVDQNRFPVHPKSGVTIRIPVSYATTYSLEYKAGSHVDKEEDEIKIADGRQVLIHDLRLRYRLRSNQSDPGIQAYVIRYFPATSQYIRDAKSELHLKLTIQEPILNHAKFPLWLVAGTDRANNDFVTGFLIKPGRWISGDSQLP